MSRFVQVDQIAPFGNYSSLVLLRAWGRVPNYERVTNELDYSRFAQGDRRSEIRRVPSVRSGALFSPSRRLT